MKTLTAFALFCMTAVVLSGCGGGSSSSSAPADTSSTSSTPVAADDSSNKGLYKGVLTGSTGHWLADIGNTDPTKNTFTFTFDGVPLTLNGVETMDGSNFVYTFTGSGYTMVLEVTPTGAIVVDKTGFTFTGHPDQIFVSGDKATSTVDVSAWEGTWIQVTGNNPGETGPWNILVKGSTVSGASNSCEIMGTVTGDAITGSCLPDGVNITGTFSGSSVSGTWVDTQAGGSGTWSGTKTL